MPTIGETGRGQGTQKFSMLHIYGIKRSEHPNVGGVSIRIRNGAPSRKGCVVNGQLAKASNDAAKHAKHCVSQTTRVPFFFLAVTMAGGRVKSFVWGGEP